MEQLQKEIGTEDAVLLSGPGTKRKPALELTQCVCCGHKYDTMRRCSRCKAVNNQVSLECQKKHWPAHKATCQAPSK